MWYIGLLYGCLLAFNVGFLQALLHIIDVEIGECATTLGLSSEIILCMIVEQDL